ncbi:hypothetical protein STEG23_020268 [Scotinomys teguina]
MRKTRCSSYCEMKHSENVAHKGRMMPPCWKMCIKVPLHYYPEDVFLTYYVYTIQVDLPSISAMVYQMQVDLPSISAMVYQIQVDLPSISAKVYQVAISLGTYSSIKAGCGSLNWNHLLNHCRVLRAVLRQGWCSTEAELKADTKGTCDVLMKDEEQGRREKLKESSTGWECSLVEFGQCLMVNKTPCVLPLLMF